MEPRTMQSANKLSLEQRIHADDLSDSQHSHVFLITGDGQLLYGVCVSQGELLSVMLSDPFH